MRPCTPFSASGYQRTVGVTSSFHSLTTATGHGERYTFLRSERRGHMKLAVLLSCCALTFGQNTSSVPEPNSHNATSSSQQQQSTSPNNSFSTYGADRSPGSSIQQATQAAASQVSAQHERGYGGLDILSDTQGVDFGPYLQRLQQKVRENWYHLIPESAEQKKGKLAVEFAISKDGKVANMHLAASSGDVALDRIAWMSITASNPFPPLPSAFTEPSLGLRLRFYYNPDKSDLSGPIMKPPSAPAHTSVAAPIPSKSGIAVSISSLGDIYVPAGESKAVTATVTGTKEQTVEWSVTGSGCSASTCGIMTGGRYTAPTARPSPPVVTLTATSKADPTAKATVNVHILEPSSRLASTP